MDKTQKYKICYMYIWRVFRDYEFVHSLYQKVHKEFVAKRS